MIDPDTLIGCEVVDVERDAAGRLVAVAVRTRPRGGHVDVFVVASIETESLGQLAVQSLPERYPHSAPDWARS
jgi:uncharacterized ferredoxin-like protein